MAGNFGSVLLDYYRRNPAERDAAGRRLGRVRTAQAPFYDAQGNPRNLAPDENPEAAAAGLRSALLENRVERQRGIDQGVIQGQGVLNLAKADRLATEEGIAGRDLAAEAEKARVGNVLTTGFADPNSPEARAAAQAASNRLAPAAGGARAQGNILAGAAATNPYRGPELPARHNPMAPELGETVINRSHRSDAAADLDRQADEQFNQGNTTEAQKLRRTAYLIRTQTGSAGGEAAEAMVGRPTAYRTASGAVFGGAVNRGTDLATQARMDEGINLRRVQGRSVILEEEAAGSMAQSAAGQAEAQTRHAGAAATAAERIAKEGTVGQILGDVEPGGPNLEAAVIYSELAKNETDPDRKKYFGDKAIEASGGQVVEEKGALIPSGGGGAFGGGMGEMRRPPTRRIVPRPQVSGAGLYTSGGGMGLHVSGPRRPAPSAGALPLPARAAVPAQAAGPAQHGAGTLTLGGVPAGRARLPNAADLRLMSDQQLLATLRQHPGDRMTREEARRRGGG